METYASSRIGPFIAGLLERKIATAVMVPARQHHGSAVMQTLITSTDEVGRADPLAPVAPTSSAALLAKITRDMTEGTVAAVLRPCEVRAFIELCKLKQASLERTLLIGLDCLGRFETADHTSLTRDHGLSTQDLVRALADGKGAELHAGIDLATACRACESPVAESVDLRLTLIGAEPGDELTFEAVSEAGAAALKALDLAPAAKPSGRDQAIEVLVANRHAFRVTLRAEYREKVSSVDGLMEVLSGCINCYNCRSACPVCYCRQCVFTSDTFDHDSRQYLEWATKRGALRMPTDTLMYHLTRMAHMSTLCVRCGQCSSACPNDISVAELFALVGEGAQKVFDYLPGRDPGEAQPLASFFQDEFIQVTGGQVK
jgi:formate dehydrogenase subunit beta